MKNNLHDVVAFNVQAISTDTTTNGNIVDTKGYDSVTFVFVTGTVTDGDYTVLIQDGDDSGLSDAAAVADAQLTNTEADTSFTADTDDNVSKTIGYLGNKRYVRFNVVSTNTSTGATVGAIALLGHPDVSPVPVN